ncbi:MAG TPA: tetratricopeptide repeat protein, partial [Polyangiales bacterium]|nr:tetratricopeptide repeat protein [Polyangiales bacterium]
MARSLSATSKVGLLVAGLRAPQDLEAETLELGPLDLDCLRAWTRRSLSDGVLREVLARSAGLPGRIEAELLRLAQQRGHKTSVRAGARSAPPALDVSSLPERERDALALLCALGGEGDAHALELRADDLPLATAAGWITRNAGRLRVRELERLLPAFERHTLRAAHERAAAVCERRARASATGATQWAEMLRQLALAERFEEVERRLRALQPIWSNDPRTFVAELPLEKLRDAGSPCLSLVAELCLCAGEFRSALSALAWVLRRRPKSRLRASCELQAAEALLQLGRGARAERLVRRWCESHVDAATRALALERSSRARLQCGDARGALTFAERGLELVQDSGTQRLLLEAQGVALSYLGELERAAKLFSAVLAQVAENEAPRDGCRLLGRRAIAAFRAGKWAEAATDHARALDLAERHALDDLVSVCLLNLGTAQQQLGELGAALRSYERGLAVAHAISRESTELTLRYNLANLCCTLGHQSGATAELDALQRRASEPQRARFEPAVSLLRAEIALFSDDLATAERELLRAQTVFSSRGLKRELAEVRVQFAKLWLAHGELERAAETAEAAEVAANAEEAQDLALLARF